MIKKGGTMDRDTICPICGGKTRTKVYDDTVLVKFPLYCPKCKKEIKIDVIQLKMVLSK